MESTHRGARVWLVLSSASVAVVGASSSPLGVTPFQNPALRSPIALACYGKQRSVEALSGLGILLFIYLFIRNFIYLFLESGEGRETERESHINVWLPLAYPQLGTWPATQACALTWESNR